jgi:alanine racemase
MSPAEPGSGHARLSIDIAAAIWNYNEIRRRIGRAEAAAVVKADAYGLGADVLSPAFLAAGCRTFFVATPEEGFTLRAALPPSPAATLYVLHGLAGAAAKTLDEAGLTPVLSSPEDLAKARAYAKARGKPLSAALHFDTGMNRLGLDADGNGPDLTGLTPTLLMSHLAVADEPEHPLNARQRDRFEALRGRFPGVRASLSGSAGVLLGSPYHYDLVRPGIALYGGNPAKAGPNPFKAVARLEAPILQCREVAAGESVGYGASYRTERATRVATLGIGYADGYLRSLGNRGAVMLGGQSAPVIGRISMDLITVDVTDTPPALSRPGQFAELMGEALTLDALAEAAGTANYEILTRLGQRLARRYPPPASATGPA